MTTCSIEDCQRPVKAKQFCKKHYDRFLRHGDPLFCKKPKVTPGSIPAWLEAHRGYTGDGCLTWPFARNANGRAHMFGAKPCRVMCEMAHGPAPTPTHHAAHSCGKGHEACIHPQHLRWATPQENEADKILHGTSSHTLTKDDIIAIRSLRGKLRNVDIASRFGISDGHVANIFRGIKWREVA